MYKDKNKGFTLIELLVVIAIIGILSSVVLASLTTARGKASNASIKADLKGARNQIEVFYDNNSTYANVCADAGLISTLDSTAVAGGAPIGGGAGSWECVSDPVSWAVQSPLKVADSNGDTYWCIDNTGTSKGEAAILNGALSCL
ncbi:MAG: type II secretion system protein [Nitrospira sp.]